MTNMRESQWNELEQLDGENSTQFSLWWQEVFGREFIDTDGRGEAGPVTAIFASFFDLAVVALQAYNFSASI